MVAVYSRKVLTWRQDTVHFGRRALVRIVSEAVHPNLAAGGRGANARQRRGRKHLAFRWKARRSLSWGFPMWPHWLFWEGLQRSRP
jgi:hypothetical protein